MTNMLFSKNLGDNKKNCLTSGASISFSRCQVTWSSSCVGYGPGTKHTGWADEGAVVVGIWKADTTKTTQDILEGYVCLYNAKLQCIFTKLKMGSARIRHFRRDLSANLRSKFKSDILFILSNSILAPKTAIQESCNMREIFCIACW